MIILENIILTDFGFLCLGGIEIKQENNRNAKAALCGLYGLHCSQWTAFSNGKLLESLLTWLHTSLSFCYVIIQVFWYANSPFCPCFFSFELPFSLVGFVCFAKTKKPNAQLEFHEKVLIFPPLKIR